MEGLEAECDGGMEIEFDKEFEVENSRLTSLYFPYAFKLVKLNGVGGNRIEGS